MCRINITVPVFNEEKELAASVNRILDFVRASSSHEYEIVIADNGSTDRTRDIAYQLQNQSNNVHVLSLTEKGRGRALKKAWSQSDADILCYMDVDLSTDLSFFPLLIQPLITGDSDLAVGSRLLDPTLTKRGLKREFISRSYNLLVKVMFRTFFSDAQCGFKGISRHTAERLLPLTEHTGWFFDSELLILAEKSGCRIFDLPVRWTDDPDSRVKILRTALEDINGLVRLRRKLWSRKWREQYFAAVLMRTSTLRAHSN
jgi:glycosyltransferase involved in cell wall biosynthesis